MPDIVQIGFTVMPGVCRSTRNIEMPRCFGAEGSVRAASQTYSARCAALVNRLIPLST